MANEKERKRERTEERKKAIQNQIDCVGSKQIYTRVSEKLANLEVDPFFYCQQLDLYNWRHEYITKITNCYIGKMYEEEKEVLVTEQFDKIFEDSFDKSIGLELEDIDQQKCMETASKFYAPSEILHWINEYQDHCSHEDVCIVCTKIEAKLRQLIQWMPEAFGLAKLALHGLNLKTGAPLTLKETTMRKVLELGLPQDCVPATLKKSMERGPEHLHWWAPDNQDLLTKLFSRLDQVRIIGKELEERDDNSKKCLKCQVVLKSLQFSCPSLPTEHIFCFHCCANFIKRHGRDNSKVHCPSGQECLNPVSNMPWSFSKVNNVT